MSRTRRFKLGWIVGGALLLLPLITLLVYNYLDQSSPRQLPKPPLSDITVGPPKVLPKIVSSGLHIVMLAEDGSLWGMGNNDWGQAGGPKVRSMAWTDQFNRFPGGSNWVDVAAGRQSTFAIRDDGTLWQWGAVSWGLSIPGVKGPVQIGTATNWSAISAGGGVFGLRTDGTLWAWGSNPNGELGSTTSGPQTNPIPLTADLDWAGIASGSSAAAAVKTNGTVWAWGRIVSGNPFQGSYRLVGVRQPFQLGTNASFVRVQCLFSSVIAEDRVGRLWRCDFSDGATQTWRPLPEIPNGLSTWSAGGFVVVVLDRTGQTWVLGRNHFGVLAKRWVKTSDEWLLVSGVNDGIAAMGGFGCAVLSKDGDLRLWGRRYDDSEGTIVRVFDRVRVWLSRYQPSLKPNAIAKTPAYEIVPWNAAKLVRTNTVAEPLER